MRSAAGNISSSWPAGITSWRHRPEITSSLTRCDNAEARAPNGLQMGARACVVGAQLHGRSTARHVGRHLGGHVGMSAYGTKQTLISTLNMSAFGAKADIPDRLGRCLIMTQSVPSEAWKRPLKCDGP